MWNYTTIREQAGSTGRVFTVIGRQPSWITRAALTVMVAAFAAIVLLLVVPALLLAAAVFFVLVLARRAWLWVRSLFGLESSGRRNVRVIVRQ
jgi:hypothetical protein